MIHLGRRHSDTRHTARLLGLQELSSTDFIANIVEQVRPVLHSLHTEMQGNPQAHRRNAMQEQPNSPAKQRLGNRYRSDTSLSPSSAGNAIQLPHTAMRQNGPLSIETYAACSVKNRPWSTWCISLATKPWATQSQVPNGDIAACCQT